MFFLVVRFPVIDAKADTIISCVAQSVEEFVKSGVSFFPIRIRIQFSYLFVHRESGDLRIFDGSTELAPPVFPITSYATNSYDVIEIFLKKNPIDMNAESDRSGSKWVFLSIVTIDILLFFVEKKRNK